MHEFSFLCLCVVSSTCVIMIFYSPPLAYHNESVQDWKMHQTYMQTQKQTHTHGPTYMGMHPHTSTHTHTQRHIHLCRLWTCTIQPTNPNGNFKQLRDMRFICVIISNMAPWRPDIGVSHTIQITKASAKFSCKQANMHDKGSSTLVMIMSQLTMGWW